MSDEARIIVGQTEVRLTKDIHGRPMLEVPELAFASGMIQIIGGHDAGVCDFGRSHRIRSGTRYSVHPDQLAKVMAHPKFTSAHTYPTGVFGERGEIGLLWGSPVFVSLDASPETDVTTL